MNDEDRRLSGAYALDAVTEGERHAHDGLMRSDAEADRETRSLSETAAELSRVSQQAPPAALRRDVLAAIKTVRPLPPPAQADTATERHLTTPVASSGSAPDTPDTPTVDAQVLGAKTQGLQTPADELDTDEQDDRASGAETAPVVELARRRGWWIGAIAAAAAAIVAGVVVVTQLGEPARSQAQEVISASDVISHGAVVGDVSVTLFVAPSEGKAVIAADEMPDAPAGRDFQVWLELPDGSMVDSGVMPRTGGGPQEFVVDGDLANAEAVAITEEPAGGSPTGPTTDPFLRIELE